MATATTTQGTAEDPVKVDPEQLMENSAGNISPQGNAERAMGICKLQQIAS